MLATSLAAAQYLMAVDRYTRNTGDELPFGNRGAGR